MSIIHPHTRRLIPRLVAASIGLALVASCTPEAAPVTYSGSELVTAIFAHGGPAASLVPAGWIEPPAGQVAAIDEMAVLIVSNTLSELAQIEPGVLDQFATDIQWGTPEEFRAALESMASRVAVQFARTGNRTLGPYLRMRYPAYFTALDGLTPPDGDVDTVAYSAWWIGLATEMNIPMKKQKNPG